MGWLMNWLEGINWEQLLHKVTATSTRCWSMR